MNRFLPFALTCVAAAAAPQQPAGSLAQDTVPFGPGAFRAPIHGDVESDYGVWATGPGYKVSFHGGGMRFHPVAGAALERPRWFGWRTLDVRVGSDALELAPRAAFAHEAWRAVFDFGGVQEVYDVRVDGVEQSFVIPALPNRDGDLVVRGRVGARGGLVAADVAAAHAPVDFFDENGRAIVRYGAVVAIDARGERYPMTTKHAGGTVELRLDARAVADAKLPLVVDPLLANVLLDQAVQPVGSASVVHSAVGGRIAVAYTREVSLGVFDVYCRVYDTEFQNGVLVFVDAAEFVSFTRPSVSMVGGTPARWVLAVEAEVFGAPEPHRIGYVGKDVSDLTLSSGVALLPQAAGSSRRNPSIGGSDETGVAPIALIVCEEESTTAANVNTPTTGVRGVLWNTNTGVTTEVLDLTGSATLDREAPDVNQKTAGGAEPWCVVWQEFDGSVVGDDWDIRAAQVSTTGFVGLDGAELLGEVGGARHNVRPRIDGRLGRYLTTYSSLANTGPTSASESPELRAHQFEWPVSMMTPAPAVEYEIRTATVDLRNVDVAYDAETEGHWLNVADIPSAPFGAGFFADRVGRTSAGEAGAIAVPGETATVFGAAFESDNGRFALVYSAPDSEPLRGVFFERGLAQPAPFIVGTGCGAFTASIESVGPPLSGNRNYSVRVTNAAPNEAVALLISRRTRSTPLDFFGFPGCTLEVDIMVPAFLTSIPGFTDGAGDRTVPFAVPPSLVNTLFFQFLYLNPTDPVLPIGATPGLGVRFTR